MGLLPAILHFLKQHKGTKGNLVSQIFTELSHYLQLIWHLYWIVTLSSTHLASQPWIPGWRPRWRFLQDWYSWIPLVDQERICAWLWQSLWDSCCDTLQSWNWKYTCGSRMSTTKPNSSRSLLRNGRWWNSDFFSSMPHTKSSTDVSNSSVCTWTRKYMHEGIRDRLGSVNTFKQNGALQHFL